MSVSSSQALHNTVVLSTGASSGVVSVILRRRLGKNLQEKNQQLHVARQLVYDLLTFESRWLGDGCQCLPVGQCASGCPRALYLICGRSTPQK